ncbi:uncharacterized protein BJ212DRAFT_1300976 [Suillus subaureus]|uniref:Uncharacterized protein n=1 Tax=Suillus subaureus TaxID=48587 RepID=A0A9P7E7G3_9AGAM|nr:uncharacterized protein BJ212DRAFT_1300976 [Suillus subaureus]KAG1813582.1 hypothetical protein BJ212DRAFT_1300976 [Suillus subaureus]
MPSTTTHTSSKSSGTKGASLSPPSVIPPSVSMSTLQAMIMAIMLSQTDLDKIKNYLLLKHGGGYILRLVACPDPSLDPSSAGHWDLNNLCIMAALHTHSSSEEQEFLCGYTNAHLAWDALKSCHEKVGPIAQILLIQQALVINIPKEEDFLTIMMLNAMAEDLPHIQNHITDALTTSTITNPYGPSHIHSRLDVEQQLLDTAKSKSGDVALAATSKGGSHYEHSSCGTCGNSSHSMRDCFSKGGAMKGKQEEVLAHRCAACEAKGQPAVTQPVCLLIFLPSHLSVMLASLANRHILAFPSRIRVSEQAESWVSYMWT